jgi:hypothetical protein
MGGESQLNVPVALIHGKGAHVSIGEIQSRSGRGGKDKYPCT